MTVADAPRIKVTGAGSRQEAAGLGRMIGDGVAAALAGRDKPMRIDTLHVRVPAGAGKAAIQRAIQLAIERNERTRR